MSSADCKKIATEVVPRRNLPFLSVTEVTAVIALMSITPSALLRSTVKAPVPSSRVNTGAFSKKKYLLDRVTWLKFPVATKVLLAATLIVWPVCVEGKTKPLAGNAELKSKVPAPENEARDEIDQSPTRLRVAPDKKFEF